MPYLQETYGKQVPAKSSLKSLQEDLIESKEKYKREAKNLEKLTAEANRLKQNNENRPEPALITFKKFKSQ